MAAPKKPRKPRGAAQKNQYSAELTSGQLVMGITILMVFGLACFLLGVLIGKVDPSIRPNTNIVAQQPDSTSDDSARDNRRDDDDDDSPRKSFEEKSVEVKTVKANPPAEKPAEKKEVKPAPTAPATAPIESSDLPPSPPIQKETPKPSPAPAKTEPKVEVKTVKANKPAPAPASPPTPAKSTNKAGWYVQIGAFGTVASAEKERTRVKNSYPHPIIIMKPSGSTLHKLFIGSYPTKAEAEKVRQKLLKNHPGLFLHHEGSA